MIELKNKELMDKVRQVEGFAIDTIRSDSTLNGIYQRMINTDDELYQHSLNVCRIAVIIGIYYNFSLEELINIAIGSLLHDVGKMLLNKEVLNKPTKITRDEHLFIEAHTSLGYKLVKDADVNEIVLDIVKSHHEKTNGLGYPDGLRRSQISIYVQIVTVADIYDALTSQRAYKESYSNEKAFEILTGEEGINNIVVSILTEIFSQNELLVDLDYTERSDEYGI